MEDADNLLSRYSRLKSIRDGYWLQVWREVRRYVMPAYSDYKSEGGARGEDIYDTTAIEARKRLAAGMYNWMAPPDKRWFELCPINDDLSKDEEVKDYFAEVSKIIAQAMANSNWPTVLIQLLNNLACGMDAICYCEDGGDDTKINFRSFPVETLCYCENRFGYVDTVFRELSLSSRQIVQMFGCSDDRIPDLILSESADQNRCDIKHTIIHAVYPRMNRNPDMKDSINMPFADVYIDLQSKSVIREGGYEEFPFAVCRFDKSDNESYGRGPGIDKLPDIKMVNRMRQSYILATEHQSDPSWLIPDGSIVGKDFNRDPGSVIFYKPDIAGGKPEPVPQTANLVKLYQDIEAEREKIKQGFFWDIFDPLGDLKQITATEAEIRNDGKMIPFAPIAGNLHSELFRVVIHRVYGILLRKGMLPDIPVHLVKNPEYKIEFVSKIALSIKKLESMGWLQTQASISDMVSLRPDLMDNFDLDSVTRDLAMANGASPKWLRTVRERDELRDRQAAMQAQQENLVSMQQAASSLGANLGRKPESGSPLDAVMTGGGI